MKYWSYLPHPRLRPYIENYWRMQSDSDTANSGECCIVPDGNPSLMFIDSTIWRRNAQESKAAAYTGQCLLIGQKSQPVFYTFPANRPVEIYGVRFRPLGMERFLWSSAADLTDHSITAEDIFGPTILHLHELLLEQPHFEAGIDFLNEFFIGRLNPPCNKYRLMDFLVQQIIHQKGQLRIGALSKRMQISPRQIDRLFQSYLGLSPKAFARIVRFNHCIYLQKTRPFEKLTDLAYAGGYFDQMHFIKEVKFFTHQTPKQYFSSPGPMGHALEAVLSDHFGGIAKRSTPANV